MSTVTGPFAVTPGGVTTLPQPYVANQDSLVLDNLSTYLLQVTIGADLFYQSPLTEAKYDLSQTSQPVQVLSILTPGDLTTTGEIAPTWYSVGEDPEGQWPIALSGPAAVAAATAAALVNGGIPNTTKVTQLTPNGGVSVGPGVVQAINAAGYASLFVIANQVNAGEQLRLRIGQTDATQNAILPDQLWFDLGLNVTQYLWIPVELGFVSFHSLYSVGIHPATIQVFGSNRVVPRFSSSAGNAIPEEWSSPIQSAKVAGTTYTMTNQNLGQTVRSNGRCRAVFIVNGGAAACKGAFILNYMDNTGTLNSRFIADTSQPEAHVINAATYVYCDIDLPYSTEYSVTFLCTVAGTASLYATIFPDTTA